MASVRKKRSNKYLDVELVTRPSWVNARIAYRQVRKGKADGNKCALWVRKHIQRYLFNIGCFIHLHCGKVLFVGLLLLSLCCVGLKSVQIETDVEKLWVEEGGRLEEELTYTRKIIGEGSGTTNQIVIQTPKSGNNVLTQESMEQHRDALIKASKISVRLYDQEWRFRDLCYLADFPKFEQPTIDRTLEQMLPCVVISPLDCFWEGSKMLGPYAGSGVSGYIDLQWTNLDPLGLVRKMKQSFAEGEAMEEVLIDSGISTAYQEKPCIDPYDDECPDTAPNKASKEVPDFGAEITNGCYGFATKYMHWHEDMIVGGVRKNQTGHIIRAEALQSIVLLKGETAMYNEFKDVYRTMNIEWTPQKAKLILETWHRKFTDELNALSNASMPDHLHAFSMTSLMDIMQDFSDISIPRVAIGYILMVFYACISLLRWNNGVQSQSGIGLAGVLLVALSVAAGLGICSVLGIKFNASTTQIIPFLALGLGVDDMFLLAHTYAENGDSESIPFKEQTAECLKRTGTTILLTSVTNMLAFFSAVIIPVPALRAFCQQAAILILFNMVSVLLIYPAICSIDLIRRKNKRIDIFCCFESFASNDVVIELQPHINVCDDDHEASPPPCYTPPPSYHPPSYSDLLAHDMISQSGPDGGPVQTTLAPHDGQFVTRCGSPLPGAQMSGFDSAANSRQCLTDGTRVSCQERFALMQRECVKTSLTTIALKHYGPFLQRTPVKVFASIFFVVILIISIWGTAQVKDGLDLTDIVPRGTSEYEFLEKQSKYFGFYNIYLVTKDLDYPRNQRLLREYHRAFQNVDSIIKSSDGTASEFWLDAFRTWLQGLQEAYDAGVANRTFHTGGWYNNATFDAIFAYKLLAQTGNIDNPVDTHQVTRVRLVSNDGIIYPDGFYNYLTAWISNDALAYSYSMGEIRPETKSWAHDPFDSDMLIPKAKSIVYAQVPFYLSHLSDTEKILDVVLEIRAICEDFGDRGLPNYPSGIPFTFWEQYIKLRFYLMLAILCILVITFLVLSIVLMNPWLATIMVIILTMVLVELFGLMGIMGLKLSAIPAVILIVTVGIGMEFTMHVSVGFITSIGSRNSRMLTSLQHTFAPVLHGAISTFLGIIMLAGAEFDFIVSYFFFVLSGMVLIGLLNGLVLLPVVLSVFGPPAEVRPKDNGDRIPTPSPESSPKLKLRNLPIRATRSSRKIKYPRRIPSDLSLTTITEEPSQYSSTEIVVNPEVVVETTVHQPDGSVCHQQHGQKKGDDTAGKSSNNSRNSSPPGSNVATPPTHHVTRVKATATVKVEVHTPLPGTVPDQEHTYKSKRRKQRQLPELSSCSSDSDSSSSSSS